MVGFGQVVRTIAGIAAVICASRMTLFPAVVGDSSVRLDSEESQSSRESQGGNRCDAVDC
jgi:hypothetical protein